MGLGSIVGAVAGIAGGAAGTKNKQVAQGGFDTLPQPVKDAYLNTYLPDVMKWYGQGYQTLPTVRYQESNPAFRSTALSNLQALSDARGGLFPMQYAGNYGANTSGGVTPLSPNKKNNAKGDANLNELIGKLLLSQGSLFTTKATAPMYAQLSQQLGGISANPILYQG